ncbi:hypothetical protein JTE90_024533 [Oedothorax gibbosus]|uniref:Ubiquitinyl hydrolase 1 n=1 Tax=Oedothorax gibbosus TaxID=931172 RepID=A0AAV6VDQ7_9ARAC|nr:hypothetical protein JTE90_024533 [Oedothorax gibbosus]
MAKKKSSKYNVKPKHQKDIPDTSEEELNEPVYQGKCCAHMPRSVNFGRVKRTLKTGDLSSCAGCTAPLIEGEETPEVWLCLQCGYRGCGRTSTSKHGLQHFATIHSDCHSLVLSPASGVVWCYDCDDEVSLQSSKSLRQCVEFIMKLKINTKRDTNEPLEAKKHLPNKQSLIETVLKEKANIKNMNSEVEAVKTVSAPLRKKKENASNKTSVKGLKNLGNTCYFNAVMQNLSQTSLLYNVLEETCSDAYRWNVPHLKVVDDVVIEDTSDDPLKIAVPKEFQLVNTFLQFLKRMSAYSQAKVEVVNPSDLFGDLQKKSPQFQYFHQQDSHELLRQFLDGIRQDEVKRQKKAILQHFNVVKVDPEDIDDDVKKLIKAYGCYASHTIVEKVFGGLLISTVLCEECKMSSQVFEPFMDMSLPLFEEKHQESFEQQSSLLDDGKKSTLKAVRIHKPHQECNENGEEYAIKKSTKDYSKPSKHQERKQKQMEKKEKKKNKKAQNKKAMNELLSQENKEPDIPTENGEQDAELESENAMPETKKNSLNNEIADLETENASLETENASLEIENGSLEIENISLETESLSIETEESNHINNVPETINLNNTVLNKEENIHNGILTNCDELEPQMNLTSNIEMEENVFESEVRTTSSKDLNVSNPVNQDFVVLFEEKLFLNGEPCATSSPTDKKKCETLLQNEDTPVSKNEDHCTDDKTELNPRDISDQFAKCVNISTNDNLSDIELDERMHNLSMQVKEMRIRKDSDRQESILSSNDSLADSTRNADCDDTPKTNNTSYESLELKEDDAKNEDMSSSFSPSQTKEWILKSLTTLKCRKHVPQLECSIDSCLMHFTKPELLTGNNKFRCENCSEIKRKKTGDKKAVVYSNASKQLLIFSPPAILTLHLKRFQQVGMSLRKVNRFVEFPLVLDLASYCSSACSILPHMSSVQNEILYSLYGVVEHSGHLKSGHYTAYVKASKRTSNHSFLSQLPLAQCDLEQLLHKFSKNSDAQSENALEGIAKLEDFRWYYISDCHVRETTEAQVLKCQAYLLFYERIK